MEIFIEHKHLLLFSTHTHKNSLMNFIIHGEAL